MYIFCHYLTLLGHVRPPTPQVLMSCDLPIDRSSFEMCGLHSRLSANSSNKVLFSKNQVAMVYNERKTAMFITERSTAVVKVTNSWFFWEKTDCNLLLYYLRMGQKDCSLLLYLTTRPKYIFANLPGQLPGCGPGYHL